MNTRISSIILLFVSIILLTACGSNSDSDNISIGNPAPDFSLMDSSSKLVTLSEYEGQAILLFFHMAGG